MWPRQHLCSAMTLSRCVFTLEQHSGPIGLRSCRASGPTDGPRGIRLCLLWAANVTWCTVTMEIYSRGITVADLQVSWAAVLLVYQVKSALCSWDGKTIRTHSSLCRDIERRPDEPSVGIHYDSLHETKPPTVTSFCSQNQSHHADIM